MTPPASRASAPRGARARLRGERLDRALSAHDAGLGSSRTHARSSTPSEETAPRLLERERSTGCRGRPGRAPTPASQPRRGARTSSPALLHQVGAGLGLESRHNVARGGPSQRSRRRRHASSGSARLAAGRRARVAGVELVHQHDVVARPASVQAKDARKRSRSDNHNPHAIDIKGQTLYLRDVFVAAALASLVIGIGRGARDPRHPRGPESARECARRRRRPRNEPAGEAIVARLRPAKLPTASRCGSCAPATRTAAPPTPATTRAASTSIETSRGAGDRGARRHSSPGRGRGGARDPGADAARAAVGRSSGSTTTSRSGSRSGARADPKVMARLARRTGLPLRSLPTTAAPRSDGRTS